MAMIKQINVNNTKYNLESSVLFIPKADITIKDAGNNTSGSYLATKWAVADVGGITIPVDGLTIAIRMPAAGTKGGILFSIDGGTKYYPLAQNVSTLITTQFAADSTVLFTFNSSKAVSVYTSAGTTENVTGCWQHADYDSNTKNSAGTSNKTGAKMYLVGGTSQNSNGVTTYTNSGVFINASNQVESSAGFKGNATSASKWATARKITLEGDVSGSVSLDGSKDVSITTTVANDSHSHSNYAPIEGGIIPSTYLPAYVDDVIEIDGMVNAPSTGESGKIYVDTSNNKTYRWSGSQYVEISASLALGTTASTAAKGNHTHSVPQHTTGAPSGTSKVGSETHTHSIPNLTFTGTAASHSHTIPALTTGAPSKTAKAGSETHTHSIPELKFTGTAASHSHSIPALGVTGTVTSHNHSIPELVFTGTEASHTHSIPQHTTGANSGTAGSVAPHGHTHNVTAAGTVGDPTVGANNAVASTTVASSDHTHSASYTPAGSVPKTGTTGTTVASSGHTHSASYTPAGSTSKTTATVIKPGSETHTHSASYTPAGSVPKTSTAASSVASSGHTHDLTTSGPTGSTSVVTSASISGTISTQRMVITGSFGTGSVASTSHTHTATTGGPSGTTSVANKDHTHSFSGTAATITTGGPSATVEAAPYDHTHGFTGTAATITTGTPSGTSTVAAQAHTHSFTGTAATITTGGPSGTSDVASTTHRHSWSGSAVTSGGNSGTAFSAAPDKHTHTASAKTSGSASHTPAGEISVGTGDSIGNTGNSSPSLSGSTATSTTGSASHTPAGTISGGTGTSLGNTGAPSATVTVASSDHTHSTTATNTGSTSVTPAGDVAGGTTGGPSATTSVASSGHTHTAAAINTGTPK